MGVADELIRVLDPRRDTGECGAVYSLGTSEKVVRPISFFGMS